MRSALLATLPLLTVACAAPTSRVDLQLLPAPTRASLRGVHAVTAAVAWVSGSEGTCLRTLDGGASWQPCPPAPARGRDLRDVHAFDALNAVVMAVGSPALLLRTADGGAAWEVVWRDDHPQAFLDAIDFLDARDGFAFGDPVEGRFVTLRTRDGGASWRRTTPAPAPQPGESAFAASGTSAVVLPGGDVLVGTGGGEVARILRGSALGERWRTHTTLLRSGAPSRGVFSLAVHGLRAVAVGGDYGAPRDPFANIAVSDDGGHTWREPTGAPPRGYRSAVAFVPRTHGRVLVTAGETGVDVSYDGGETWEPLADEGFHALSFAPDGTGYAAGSGGRIAKLAYAAQ